MAQNTVEINASAELARKPLLPTPVLEQFSGHQFAPAPNGVDSNLLILLHGLGDTDGPFFNLGQSLQKTLPQTAVLTLQGPNGVPFLDPGQHWMWYPTFDQFGEMLTAPNPTPTVQNLTALLQHLVEKCGWPAKSIHMFGFGQGATVALETLVSWAKTHPEPTEVLGSIVSVSGAFVSHPTLSAPTSTPVLQMYRSRTDIGKDSSKWASFRKATAALQLHRLPLTADGGDEAMLRGAEWDGVMQFWAKFFRNRSSWEVKGDIVPLS